MRIIANFFTELFSCCHEREAGVTLPGTPQFSKQRLKNTIAINVHKFRRRSSLQNLYKMGVCSSPKYRTHCGSSNCNNRIDPRKSSGLHTARFGAKKMVFCSTKCWELWVKNPTSSSFGNLIFNKHTAKKHHSPVKKNPSFSNIAKQIARAPTPVGTNAQGYAFSKQNESLSGKTSFSHLYYASDETVGVI